MGQTGAVTVVSVDLESVDLEPVSVTLPLVLSHCKDDMVS